MAGRRRRARGFTLIELLVVMAILGAALAVVALRGPGGSARLTLDGAARDVAGALRSARAQAIALDRGVTVSLDAAGHRLLVSGAPDRVLPTAIDVAIVAPIRPGQAEGAAPSIVFAADGSASGGTITLTGPARRVSIGVDWLTGRVSIAEAAVS